MLSIENRPPDPLEISQLKSSDDEKIKASSDKLALQEVDLEVEKKIDLLKSSLDDKKNNKNPPPKFSIRDYVFSTRSKDITASWPFSEKYLQLCLKHGVKELLPPFQPLDSVRNLSKRCAVYDKLLDQENLSKTNGETSRQSDQYVSASSDGVKCNQKLTLDRVHIISSRSDQKEKEFPSTEEQAHPEVDSGADTLLESSSKHIEAAILPETHKTDSIIFQPPIKKCRLIVKLSNITGSSTKEDNNMPNSFMVSETMASKLCPVCKTFSSSSNTTLNAHIDQCLSGESTMKWTADPKVIKHRIKPRKTRLMVDIYLTAQYCTLEDLDRRNGTSWAISSTLPVQETELCIEERVQRVPTAAPEETGDQEGAVYIDTDGTKVRILSKFSETMDSNVGEDPGHRKLLKGDKGSKFLIAKKRKKPNVQKNQKFLKLSPRGNSCSPKPCPSFETSGGQKRNLAMEQDGEKEVRWGQRVKAQEQVKLNDPGIIRQWVCSKRTGLTKKATDQDDHQHSGRNKDLLRESDQSSLLLKNPHLSKNSSSPQSSKRMETASYEPGTGLCRERPNLRKGEEFPLLGSRGVGYWKRSMMLPKLKKLRKEGISVHDSSKNNPKYAATRASSSGNKAVEINAAPTKTSDAFFVGSKPSFSHQAFSSKATKFSSKRKKLLSKNQASSKSDFKRKHSSPTRSQVDSRSDLNDDLAAWPSQVDDDKQFDSMQEDNNEKQLEMEEINNKLSRSSTRVLKIRKNRIAIKVSRKEESAVGLASSLSEPLYYGHGVDENMDFSSVKFGCSLEDTSDDEDSVREEVLAHGKHIAFESYSKTAVGGSFMSSSNSLDREFNDLPSPTTQRCADVNQGHLCRPECPICPNDRSMGDNKQELFSSDEIGHVMIGEETHMGAESDSKDGQVNYFSEVDPIPIPGPPGSFLPSPGHMESEDLQGNSTLITCRVQSMDDHHDLVDRDMSDSPVSTISGISNPTFARSESRSSEKFFVGPHAVQDDTRQGFSSAGVDPVVENFVPVSQAANFGAERPNLDALRVNVPVSLKTEQSCCCSRKEGASLGVALNFQESQLLKRRTMASVPLPGKQMDSDSSKRHSNLNSRSEMFSLTNFPNLGPEKVVHHSMKLAAGNIPMKVSADPEVKFPIRGGDHDSASPSASNPVLRLMGKNLMVVNKDEDVSRQLRPQHQSCSVNGHPNLLSCTVSGVSCGSSVGNEDYHSFHQAVPQGPMIVSHDRHDAAVGQHFDARLSNNFRSNIDFNTRTPPFHAPGVMFSSMNAASGAFKASLEQRGEYKGGSNMLASHEHRLKNKLDKPSYDLDKNVATSRPHKEIIIIDDVPENEAESVIDAMCNDGMRRNLVSSSGVSVPRASDYGSRLVDPYYCNQLDGGGSMYGGRPVLHNASFQMAITAGGNASPAKWNCNPEGSSIRRQSSLGAPSPSAGHLRHTFYYSPSFS